LHPWLSRRDRLDHPDLLALDLDPSGDDFEPVRVAALRARELFETLGLPCYPKLTGSRGIHVVVPLDRSSDFDAARSFARAAADLLEARFPDELTTEQSRSERRGRLYLDTGRNAFGQTAVAPWSVRPLPDAPVAAPLAWRDLARPGLGPRDYSVENVFRSLGQRGDPWAGMRRRAHSLGPAREKLERLQRDEGF
jgi:bifunctional non-homologous end joining protein LigD